MRRPGHNPWRIGRQIWICWFAQVNDCPTKRKEGKPATQSWAQVNCIIEEGPVKASIDNRLAEIENAELITHRMEGPGLDPFLGCVIVSL